MIPLWKLQREIKRIGLQIAGIPSAVVDLVDRIQEPARRREHFAKLSERVAVVDGNVLETDRVAIFLIYQPKGVADSIIATCEDLVRVGFSPFVVSNSALSDEDTEKLKSVSWKLMTRPNFGYDFGGYQDALFALREIKLDLTYLIVMNDSVWLHISKDLVDRLIFAKKSVMGLVQENRLRFSENTGFFFEKQNIQSYFYLIDGNLLNEKSFWDFWIKYKMISNKQRTIKRGEIAFTQHLVESSIDHSAIVSKENFLENLYMLDNFNIAKLLPYITSYNRSVLDYNKKVLDDFADTENWRKQALEHIIKTLIREPLNSTFWIYVCEIFNIILIKKNKEPINCSMRKNYLSAIGSGIIKSPPDYILSELKIAVRQDRKSLLRN